MLSEQVCQGEKYWILFFFARLLTRSGLFAPAADLGNAHQTPGSPARSEPPLDLDAERRDDEVGDTIVFNPWSKVKSMITGSSMMTRRD
jgi:hypothetical protein